MQIIKTKFNDVKIFKPKKFNDNRGYFTEIFNKKNIAQITKENIVQINYSFSKKKNTFRGLHFQKSKYAQSKIITVINGEIDDYIFCLKNNSNDFGKYIKINIKSKNLSSVYVPKGYAHGFLTKKENTLVMYTVDVNYNKKMDDGISVLDENIKIKIPKNCVLSKKDLNLSFFNKNKKYF